MSLFVALFIGLVVGALVSYFTYYNVDTLILSLIFAVAGSLIGLGVYFFFLNGNQGTVPLFSWTSVVCSAVFALIASLSLNGLHSLAIRGAVNGSRSLRSRSELRMIRLRP